MTGRARAPIVCITQARVNSTRLPAKVLRPIAGRPMLAWHLDRLKQSRRLDAIIVATTEEPGAEAICAIAHAAGVGVFQGDETDVLDRFARAAAIAKAATIVRVTSDCPLIDAALIDAVIELYDRAPADCHYASLDVAQFPRGLDCEVFSRIALAHAAADAVQAEEREHVTPFIRRHYERHGETRLGTTEGDPRFRWCVDTAEDFELARRVIEHFAPARLDFSWAEIAALMRANPTWPEINAHIRQKSLHLST